LFFQHQTYYNSFGCHHLSFRCFVCVGESVSVCDCVRVIRVKVWESAQCLTKWIS
jgi:hypothetical protein